MANGQEREYVLDYPNRRKSSAKTTKAVIALLLVVSGVLMAIVTISAWGKLYGTTFLLLIWIIAHFVMAWFVLRWNRGVLTLASASAIFLGIFAAISGPAWFDRDKIGFAVPHTIWGAPGLGAGVIGLIVLILVPIQVLLLGFAMTGFSQNWNVEEEVPRDEIEGDDDLDRGQGGRAEPATA